MRSSQAARVFLLPLYLGAAALLLAPARLEAQGLFVRGDCNQDLQLDITDPVFILDFLFLGNARPRCLDACDYNDTEDHDISDAVFGLNFLFLGGTRPPPPFPTEGPDPSGEALDCDNGQMSVLELRVGPPELVFYRLGEVEPLTVVGVAGADASGVPSLVDLRLDPRTFYESSRAEVAQVSPEGIVTARSPGQATITVLHRHLAAQVRVRVAESAGTAPVLRLAAPPDGSVITSAAVMVLGTVSDPSATVRVNGILAAVEGTSGTFRLRLAISLGTTRIEVTASSPRGSSRTEVAVMRALPGSTGAVGPDGEPLPVVPEPFTLSPDRVAPRVEIQAPRHGALLGSSLVEVRGSVDDPLAVVRVNGTPAEVAQGTFRAHLTLPRGPSTIEAEAFDQVRNRGTDRVDVAVDAELATVSITHPPLTDLEGHRTAPHDATVVRQSPVEVRGTLSRPGMQVWIQGSPAVVSGTSFSGSASLVRGINRVAVLAEVPGTPPRRALAVRRVVLDLDPPEIEVLYPPNGYRALATPLRIAGRARDPRSPPGAGRITLRVNGTPVEVNGGSFEAQVALQPGPGNILLSAVDAAGRETLLEVPVVLETPSGPSLEVVDGNGQIAAAPGAALSRSFVVRARDAAGAPAAGVPVVFQVLAGDGALAGGARERQILTDASGEARVSFQAGLTAGRGLHVVTARSPERRGSPLAFVASVSAGPLASLTAHSPRWRWGPSGFALTRPLEVRALDGAGNPLSGVPVEFRVASGSARVSGALTATRTTGPAGIASVTALPGSGDAPVERSVVIATAPGGRQVTFHLDSFEPGPPADTRARGQVADPAGNGLAGAVVRALDVPGTGAVTGEDGRFEVTGLPWGPALLEVEPPSGEAGAGGDWAGGRFEVDLLPGRITALEEPFRLQRITLGPRAVEVPVSEVSGATAAVPAIPGLRLEIAPGSALFPDGSRRGRVLLAAASVEAFPRAVPDSSAIAFPVLVRPEGMRFDPPAQLFLPSSRHARGREVPLLSFSADAGGFVESGRGQVGQDGSFIESLPGLGVAGGGLALYALPGPEGGVSAAVEGSVASAAGPARAWVDDRPGSAVLGKNVYAHSGEFFLEEVDLEIPGRGLDYRFRRRYESRHLFRGSLGHNWEHEYADRRLEPVAGTDNLLRADGRGRFDEYLLSSSTRQFISPPGVFARLFAGEDGRLVEREPDGTRYLYHPLDGSRRSGRLVEIADSWGNRLAIARDDLGQIETVLDTMGREVLYEYDELGRIVRIGDFAGRVVDFTYDDRGDLVAVTGPSVTATPNGNNFPAGRTTGYEYTSGTGDARLDHNLLRIHAPTEVEGGPPWLVNHYDEALSSPALDRVVAQEWGGTNASGVPAGGRLSLRYRLAPDPLEGTRPEDALLAPGGLTEHEDRRGVRTEVEWNRLGLPTAVRRYTTGDLRPRDAGTLHPPPGVDPPFFETRHTWSEEGLLLETVLPRGNRLVHERDTTAPLRCSRADLTRLVHHPAPGSAGAPQVWTFVREPLFGRCIREVPPSGNEPGVDPQRFATRRFVDYQEGAELSRLAAEAGVEEAVLAGALARVGVELGQGDLNGDGEVSQAGGAVVRTVHPPVTLADGTVQEAVETEAWNHLGQLVAHTDAEGSVTRLRYHIESDPDGDGEVNPLPGLNPNTGGYLAERLVDAENAGPHPPARLRTEYLYDPLGKLARITDPRGNATELVHNELGELVQYRAPEPFAYLRWFRYDAAGRMVALEVENWVSEVDGLSLPILQNRWIRTSWTHDILGQVVEETREVSEGGSEPARHVTTRWRYDAEGALAAVLHPEGGEERFRHDERGLLFESVRGAGEGVDPSEAAVERYDYDPNGNLVRVVGPADADKDGAREVHEYRHDGLDRLAAILDPAGGAWVLERDSEGRVVGEAFLGSPGGRGSGEGAVLLFRRRREHDERGRENRIDTARFGPGVGAGAPPLVETRFHDRQGRLVKRVDPAGGVWTEEWDGAGRPVRSTDPAGGSVSRRFDPNGNLVLETRLEVSDVPLDPEAGAGGDPEYDSSGRLRRATTTAHAYDSLNRLSAKLDPSGRTRRYRYDSRSNLVHRTDGVGTVIHAATDPELAPLAPLLAARQAENVNSHGNQVHVEYDGRGLPVRVIHDMRKDGLGQLSLDHQNPFNDDGLVEVRFEWDDDGRLEAWVDDRRHRTTISYDPRGRPAEVTGVDGRGETYEHDLAGNPVAITDRAGNIIRQSVDALGRVVERTVQPSGPTSGAEGSLLQRFEYDGLGRPVLAYDQNLPEDTADDLLVLRAYSSVGELAWECQGPYVVGLERDAAARLTAVAYPDGRRLLTPRDLSGRVRELADGTRLHALYRYMGRQVLERVLGNGLRQSYLARDPSGVPRLTGLNPSGEVEREEYRGPSGGLLLGIEAGRDREGRRLSERKLHRQGRGPAYLYDSLGRPREMQPDLPDPRFPNQSPLEFVRLYQDGIHNPRLSIVNLDEKRIEVDLLDRITSVDGEVVTHDLAGNLSAARSIELRHDVFGRLKRVLRGGSTAVRFAHDAVGAWTPRGFRLQGRPALRETVLPLPGETAGRVRTVFLFDLPIEERVEGVGLLRQYLHGPEGRPLVALETSAGAAARYFLYDTGGSVAGVADAQARILEEVSYDVLGLPLFRSPSGIPIQTSEIGNRVLLGGRRWDAPARLHEAGARHYSPDLGRFTSPAWPEIPPDPLSLNRYALLDPLNGFPAPRGPAGSEGSPGPSPPAVPSLRHEPAPPRAAAFIPAVIPAGAR